jgi:hypothetical protein
MNKQNKNTIIILFIVFFPAMVFASENERNNSLIQVISKTKECLNQISEFFCPKKEIVRINYDFLKNLKEKARKHYESLSPEEKEEMRLLEIEEEEERRLREMEEKEETRLREMEEGKAVYEKIINRVSKIKKKIEKSYQNHLCQL